jgi:hypothetical protein
MRIKYPCVITPRLIPGVAVGKSAGFVSIEYSSRAGDDGRTRYKYYIDLPGTDPYASDDLQSGCQGGNLREGLSSLLSFLSACAESVSRTGGAMLENVTLFPVGVANWAYNNSDELAALAYEVEETPDCIAE